MAITESNRATTHLRVAATVTPRLVAVQLCAVIVTDSMGNEVGYRHEGVLWDLAVI